MHEHTALITELADLLRPTWPEVSARIPDWHPRNEDPPAPAADPAASDEPVTLTFTQDKLDRIIASRVQAERAKYPDYDDLKTKAARADELEAAQLTETERLQRERDEAKAEVERVKTEAEATLRRAKRTQIAASAGLPEDLIPLLIGDTDDELKAHAATLAEKYVRKTPEGEDEVEGIGGGTPRRKPKSDGGWTREKLKRLRKTPAGRKQINDAVEKGELSLTGGLT